MTIMDMAHLDDLFAPLIFITGGILTGLISEIFVLKRLKRLTHRTPWEGDEIIISSLKGFLFFIFTFLGGYFALKSYIKAASYVDSIEKGFTVILIVMATVVFMKISSGLVQLYSRRITTGFLSTSMFGNITGALVLTIGILMALQSLNISIAPLLTALGVGGIAVALALQDTLANLFAGLHIIVSKQIKPGEYIRLSSGEEGFVMDITWRYSHIRALSNNMTIIPNTELAKAIVINYDLPEKEMAVLIQVGVSYDSNLEKVETVTQDVAKKVMEELDGGVAEFDPFIRYHTFGDFSIGFTVILRSRQFTDQYLIKHEFIKRLHRRYREEGINIPFPIQTIRMEQGDIRLAGGEK